MSLGQRFIIKYILFSVCFIVANLSPLQGQDVEKKIKKEIKKILRYEVEWNKKLTPGFTVIFIEPDTSFTVQFGQEINSNEEMAADRLFSIGGLSKVYTTIAVTHAIQRGAIDTTSKANEILPSLFDKDTFGVLDLVRHTAGFIRIMKGLQVGRSNEYEAVSYREYEKAIAQNPLKKQDFLYNHNDYALLELWVQTQSSKSIAEWYEEARTTYPDLPPWREKFQATLGLNSKGRQVQNIEYGIFSSALGLYATGREIEALTRFLLAENPISLYIKEGEHKTGIAKNINFSNGLYRIGSSKKHTLYGHGGKSANNHVSLHFVPETSTGIVILSNSQTGTNPLYLYLISMINDNWKR